MPGSFSESPTCEVTHQYRAGGAGVGAGLAVGVLVGAVAVRNGEGVVVDALVGGRLVLPRADDHHCGLAGLEGFAGRGVVQTRDGVAAVVEVTHLLQEGLVLLGVDGDLAVGGVQAGAVALHVGGPAGVGHREAVLRTVGLGELLGDLEELVPGGRNVLVGVRPAAFHMSVLYHTEVGA